MKIKEVRIKNFRVYKNQIEIPLDNLNVFIGKNDIGKSSILEALDIFFNDKDASVKLEKNDLNKTAEKEQDEEISISVVFADFPEEIDIDSGNKTTFKSEYLLNNENLLEIKKVYKNGRISDIFIRANHPTSDLAKDLLLKKQADLKKIVEDNNFTCSDKKKNAELRRAIRENSENLKLEEIDISINKKDTDAKAMWDNLQKYLPVYALFQSDRSNNDQDTEVQDPMKLAVKEVIQNPGLQKNLKKLLKKLRQKQLKLQIQPLKN